MKLKETLNLGKTAFPMRAGLPNKEPIWQKEWEDAKMYQRRQELNQGKPHFTLHDGPPYANGNIHVGHAMNKISKDIIVRSKSMSGFYAPYVPGWDTHGLPIEQVLAKQGVKRKELDRAEYLKMCRDYALSQVDKQREDFKRLGVSADWDNPYVTLTPDYEAAQIRVFGEMAKKGYIYQGAKPVYWSWSSESALAEAEIEYHDLVSTSLYYANKVKDGKGVLDTDTYIVVWTTTPFTVTASRGLTVGADIEYVLVKPAGEDRKFVVASELLNSLSEKFGWTDVEVLQSYRGEELNQIVTEHPWDTEVDELVILGDHVTTDSGTGIVHTAPGFGEDDYNVGIANGLEVAVTVNERGIMMENAGPDFAGQFYDKVAPTVIEKLGTRKGEMVNMAPSNGGYTRIEFNIPARGLIGYRNEFLTDTRGNGIINTVFNGYEPYKGEIPRRNTGSLISFETGDAVTYGLYNAQERGSLFIGAGVPVYEGMVVGASPKTEDLVVNVCKRKHLTNTRASGSDDALRLVPPRIMSLEDCLEFLADDELLEVTPKSLRIRKQILSNQLRAKQRGKLK